ncbi:unnamed protein product [Calypogeia fissa]
MKSYFSSRGLPGPIIGSSNFCWHQYFWRVEAEARAYIFWWHQYFWRVEAKARAYIDSADLWQTGQRVPELSSFSSLVVQESTTLQMSHLTLKGMQ